MECRLLQKWSVVRQQNNIKYSRSACLLDVVVREGPAVLKLLAGEDKALLVRRDAGTEKIADIQSVYHYQLLHRLQTIEGC